MERERKWQVVGRRQGRRPKQRLRKRTYVLSEKKSLTSDDWFLFSRPLLLLVKREEKCLDVIGG
jgi:hypothetical protein